MTNPQNGDLVKGGELNKPEPRSMVLGDLSKEKFLFHISEFELHLGIFSDNNSRLPRLLKKDANIYITLKNSDGTLPKPVCQEVVNRENWDFPSVNSKAKMTSIWDFSFKDGSGHNVYDNSIENWWRPNKDDPFYNLDPLYKAFLLNYSDGRDTNYVKYNLSYTGLFVPANTFYGSKKLFLQELEMYFFKPNGNLIMPCNQQMELQCYVTLTGIYEGQKKIRDVLKPVLFDDTNNSFAFRSIKLALGQAP